MEIELITAIIKELGRIDIELNATRSIRIEAFYVGWNAASQGSPLTDCPYESNSESRTCFMNGYKAYRIASSKTTLPTTG